MRWKNFLYSPPLGSGISVALGLLLALLQPVARAQTIEASGDVRPQPPTPLPPVWEVGSSVHVGETGVGSLSLGSGAQMTSGNGYIGEQSGSNGSVTLSGASRWSTIGSIFVGYEGTGSLTIQDRAQVDSEDGYLADLPGSNGYALVTGTGSRWRMEKYLFVGTSGTGQLRVENGGTVSSDYTYLGLDTPGRGTITVEGPGSLWTNTGDVLLGSSGTGILQVRNGGRVDNATAYLGEFSDGTGIASVSGTNAVWNNQALIVGTYGKGTLGISNAGLVRVSGNVLDLAQFASATGLIYIGAASSNPGDAVAAGSLEAAQLRFGEGAGTLNFNHSNSGYVFGAAMSTPSGGTHQINHYAGETRLTGDSSGFLGRTQVLGGDLIVEGQLGGTASVNAGQLRVNGVFGGPVGVSQGGTLSGTGRINGSVDFSSDGILAGVQGQQLTIAGNLALDSASQVKVGLGAASTQALFKVGGNLVLDGGLQVSDLGGFGSGIYRLFDYGGALTDRGLTIAATPSGVSAGQLFVQTSVAGQVNLASAVGETLNFWDGSNTALHDNSQIDGGSGPWRADGRNWSRADGVLNGPFQPNPGFAVFQAQAGTVTVDRTAGAIGVAGMQFASDGYRLEGDAIDLQGAAGESLIRVGDGSAAGANMSATINATLSGASKLVKTDLGTLVLGGSNRYSGGTRIDSGVLAISSDANLGANSAGLELNGGTLATTASFDTGRQLTLSAPASRVQVAGGTELGLSASLVGSGGLVKQGAGTLRLDMGGNSYGGNTEVAQGRLLAGAAQVLNPASVHNVAAGAVLDLAGHDQTLATLNNSGRVTLSSPAGSQPGTVLKLTGPYVGNGGTLALSTVLKGAGGPSDQLLLSGSKAVASGNTTLVISNAGGMGAATDGKGIPVVVTENGASLQAGSFTLASGHVDAGAYEYQLQSDASGASLHSSSAGDMQPSYRAEAALLVALPAQLRQADLAMLGNRHQRMGDETTAPGSGSRGRKAWGRLVRSDPSIRQQGVVSAYSQAQLTGFQAGLDVWSQNDWTAGFYVGQLGGDMQVQGFSGGEQGRRVGFNSLRNRYLGVYGSYQNARDFYLDAVLQAADYRSDLHTQRNARAVTEGQGWLASLETGQAWSLPHGWQIEPQTQLTYRRARMENTSLAPTQVTLQTKDDWMLRLGARIKGRFPTAAGVFQPSARINLYHASRSSDLAGFMTSTTTTEILGKGGHTSTELAFGATLQLDPLTSIYGELGKLWANAGDTRIQTGLRASLGVKRSW